MTGNLPVRFFLPLLRGKIQVLSVQQFSKHTILFMEKITYRGRFAPTPSGPLHFGSLTSCLGSYLDARAHQGKWLIRIEDVDSSRSKAEYQQAIIRSLSVHGFESDEPIRVQSAHLQDYYHALAQLTPHLYPCTCSRQQWQAQAKNGALGKIYPQYCRHQPIGTLTTTNTAIRLALPDTTIAFTDRVCGQCSYQLSQDIGDPILRRRDGDIAYALAVVVDDALQNITHIVRGKDLLAHTPIQRILQEQLGYPHPQTFHLPLVRLANGDKLSKQNHAPALEDNRASENLIQALQFLGQDVAGIHDSDSPQQILSIATQRWNIHRIAQV